MTVMLSVFCFSAFLLFCVSTTLISELNRLLENSYTPSDDSLSVLSKPSGVSYKANGLTRDSAGFLNALPYHYESVSIKDRLSINLVFYLFMHVGTW